VNEPLTPDERARYMAELKAEALREAEWESAEEHLILQLQKLEEKGGYSGEEILAESFDGKPVFIPPWD
jgi:hypothetical protein